MSSARDRAVGGLKGAADSAFIRADQALRDAKTQDEVDRIRDHFVRSVQFFGETAFVDRPA